MIKRVFTYNGRVVVGYYRPEILAEFEKVKHCYPNIYSRSNLSRAYLADKIVDAETGEVLKDV